MRKAKKTAPKKSSKAKKAPSIQSKKDLLLSDIWPIERDIVVRPERMRYVRRMIKTKGCVFCEAATTQDRDERHVLLRSRNAMVILNKYPYNSGHLLVLPLRHEGELPNLKDKEFQELNLLVRESVRLLKAEYHCEGLNVGLNLGAAAGAGIPEHLHYHIIPRWFGDTNFFPLIAETKLTVETPEQTYSRLKAAFLKLEKELK